MIKKIFITGLVLALPLAFTLFLTYWIFELLSDPFYELFHGFLGNKFFSQVLSLVMVAALLIIIGFLGKLYFVKRIMRFGHKLLLKIPFLKKIYHATHEVVSILLRDKERGFSKVVLVPYPTKERRVIGFVPRSDIKICPSLQNRELVPVLIPGAPNPLMGFLVFIEKQSIVELPISVQEAFKWTLSLSAVHPKTF